MWASFSHVSCLLSQGCPVYHPASHRRRPPPPRCFALLLRSSPSRSSGSPSLALNFSLHSPFLEVFQVERERKRRRSWNKESRFSEGGLLRNSARTIWKWKTEPVWSSDFYGIHVTRISSGSPPGGYVLSQVEVDPSCSRGVSCWVQMSKDGELDRSAPKLSLAWAMYKCCSQVQDSCFVTCCLPSTKHDSNADLHPIRPLSGRAMQRNNQTHLASPLRKLVFFRLRLII